jgi:hypothetical protein
MPIFAVLFKAIMGNLVAFVSMFIATKYAMRMAAVLALAAIYITAVTLFSTVVSPLIGSLFATGYGQFIGLAFPPIAGTVVSGLAALWTALVSFTYYQRFARILVP